MRTIWQDFFGYGPMEQPYSEVEQTELLGKYASKNLPLRQCLIVYWRGNRLPPIDNLMKLKLKQ